MRAAHLVASLLLAAGPDAAANIPDSFPADGWYSWRVSAVEGAPNWCCLDWNGGESTPATCKLDDSSHSFGNFHSSIADTGELQIYVRIENNKADCIRALSPACPIEARSVIADLGKVDAAESVDWLKSYVRHSGQGDTNVLPAIAVHDGTAAYDFVNNLALNDEDTNLREDAVFWLGQVRIVEGKDTLVKIMFDDRNAGLRERAAFSLSQSSATDVAPLLIKQGREDHAEEVRSKAWFWLAQTGAAESEAAILQAVKDDANKNVREEAIFALSQLPDDQGVTSLLKVLNDKRMDRELREKALFWLAESDSDLAYAAIDKLLSAR